MMKTGAPDALMGDGMTAENKIVMPRRWRIDGQQWLGASARFRQFTSGWIR